MLDGTLRVRFKDRDLAFTPFKTLPVPPPVEDDKTLDARLDAVIGTFLLCLDTLRRGVDVARFPCILSVGDGRFRREKLCLDKRQAAACRAGRAP